MKKILSYLFIIIGLGMLVAGTSRYSVAYMWERKRHEKWWGEHQNFYGDLTRISYLDDIKYFRTPADYKFVKPADSAAPKDIDLYLWGDSYTQDIPRFAFTHTDSFHYGRSRHGGFTYSLRASKRNILILEASERYIRCDYDKTGIYALVKKKELPQALHNLNTRAETHLTKMGLPVKISDLFNERINQNMEYLFFNLNLLAPPRKWKADMNYYLFNRASGNVVISADGKHLFLKETAEPKGIYSSYAPLTANEISHFAANFNAIYDHYRAEGFDEVYFALIPNPVSLLQPGQYNNLIPALQNYPGIKMQFIDVYSVFKQSPNPRQYFRAGDTHWNNKGIQQWLALVNNTLRKESEKFRIISVKLVDSITFNSNPHK